MNKQDKTAEDVMASPRHEKFSVEELVDVIRRQEQQLSALKAQIETTNVKLEKKKF